MAQNVIINGVTYSNVPEVNIPKAGGGTAVFYDSGDATANAADVVNGKTFYKNGKQVGTMPDNGQTGGTISTKAGVVTIPAGKTTGGSVSISAAEQAKIIAGNIRAGVSILGQAGKSTVVDTEISSGGATASHIVNGFKAYVNGALVNGSATMPTVTQDSTTKVLTIS